jgi:hypothetical protein
VSRVTAQRVYAIASSQDPLDAPRLLEFGLGLNDPSPDRPDSHCNFGGVTLGAEVVRELTIGVPG